MNRGDGIDYAIRAHVRGRLIKNRNAGIGGVIDEERGDLKINFGHAFEREVKRRHHRSDCYSINGFEIKACDCEQIATVHSPLVHRASARRRQTPMIDKRFTIKHSQRSVRVTDVDYQQHASHPFV